MGSIRISTDNIRLYNVTVTRRADGLSLGGRIWRSWNETAGVPYTV